MTGRALCLTLVGLLPLQGCLKLDSFVFNPVHCSKVSAETCEGKNAWDAVCTPCEEDYDWGKDYPWLGLDDGQEIREPAVVAQLEMIQVDSGELDAYWIPSHGEAPELDQITILYNHGNYAGIEHYLPRIRTLHEIGYNVLVWDYRGYGKSMPATTPSPQEFLADARTVRLLADDYAPDPEKIVPYANSLGGIPTTEMALNGGGCTIVFETAFTSLERIASSVAASSMKEQFFSEGLYDNIARMEGYDGPVFGMTGDADNKFPVEDQRDLVEATSGESELWVLPGVKHGIANIGVVEAGYTNYAEKLSGFLLAPGRCGSQ